MLPPAFRFHTRLSYQFGKTPCLSSADLLQIGWMNDKLDQALEGATLPRPARRREIREAGGLSLTEFARILGVSRTTLWRWEHDLTDPHPAHRRLYAGALQRISETVEWGPSFIRDLGAG